MTVKTSLGEETRQHLSTSKSPYTAHVKALRATARSPQPKESDNELLGTFHNLKGAE